MRLDSARPATRGRTSWTGSRDSGASTSASRTTPTAKTLTDGYVLYDSKDLTTHAVCVGMTGSGKTGLCVGADRGGRDRRHPLDRHRPEGRPRQPAADLPGAAPGGLPAVDQRGRCRQGRRLARRLREVAGRAVDEGPRRLGPGRRAHRAAARRRRLRDLHARQRRRPARLGPRLVRAARRPLATPRRVGDQIGAIATGLLALLGIDADPIKSREHILLSSILGAAWANGQALDIAGADRADPEAAVRQDRRARPRLVLPAEGSLRARARAQQPARRAGLPALDAGRAARRRAACCAATPASRASRSSRSRTSRTPSACSS